MVDDQAQHDIRNLVPALRSIERAIWRDGRITDQEDEAFRVLFRKLEACVQAKHDEVEEE